MAQIIDLPVDHVKYIEVEIKSPGFKMFTQVIPVRGDISIKSLADRFHNLHPEVENTVKQVGYLFPPIEWRYLHPTMDMVVERSKSEWVRLRVVEKPNGRENEDERTDQTKDERGDQSHV